MTAVLAATSAGDVFVGILVHNSQATEGYMASPGLLKSCCLFSFGGLQSPVAFMTDSSAAERAVFLETARGSCCAVFMQYKCNRTCLTLAKHGVREDVVSAFQKVTLM